MPAAADIASDAVGESIAERHLFVAGCPRSGTSALTFLLDEHPRLMLGFERFKKVRAQLQPAHFTPGRFLEPVAEETDIRGELLYGRLRRRWESGTVRVVGDKVPLYTRVLPRLLERFPGARVVVLVRDPLAVARSFRRRAGDPADWWPAENDHTLAVRMWNETLAAVRAVDEERGRAGEGRGAGRAGPGGFALLPYEALLGGDERWLGMLLDFIDVPLTARLRSEHRRLAARWQEQAGARSAGAAAGDGSGDGEDDGDGEGDGSGEGEGELRAYVQAHRDAELERWARARMAWQLQTAGTPLPPGPGEDEPPLTAQEVGEREREREELLEEMRRPWQRRGGAAGAGARTRMKTEAPQDRTRVTFVLPHQRATTGGVYVIEQFARHLAAEMKVCLAVRERPARAVPGVEVRWVERLDGGELPAADVLVYPADLRDGALIAELPAAVGRPVLFFQGYGTPGSPVVEANLAAAGEAVAIAHWLVDVAAQRGTSCTYVPQGLDRAVFAPGPPQLQRAQRITVMTHALDWKGLHDALAALELVRAQRPGVEMVLFGTESVEGWGEFVERPTRPQVAELLRTSAVHVVASWEEGFGLTGAEAIACGAALASTDTKGSRDYALDGATALVSAPRDPPALARNVVALLDDVDLRARMVAAGQRHLREVMPPWPQAARRMALALGCATAPAGR